MQEQKRRAELQRRAEIDAKIKERQKLLGPAGATNANDAFSSAADSPRKLKKNESQGLESGDNLPLNLNMNVSNLY